MITIGEIEFEPDQTKIVDLATRTVGLLAGSMGLHAGIIVRVRERISESLQDDPSNINVSEIAKIYAEEFAYFRRKGKYALCIEGESRHRECRQAGDDAPRGAP